MLMHKKFLFRGIYSLLAFVMAWTSGVGDLLSVKSAHAADLALSTPGTMVALSKTGDLPLIQGIKFDPANPFDLQFILERNGQASITKEEQAKLIRYFFAGLTVAEEDLWVNLSPYENDRIIDNNVEKTEIADTFLAQDYLLKQLSSSITHPATQLGEAYWSRVNSEERGVSRNSFSKIWISPANLSIYDAEDTLLINELQLKVETEADYLAAQNNSVSNGSSSAVKDYIIPALAKEVNAGTNFAPLRQMINSIALAQLFKKKFSDSLYSFYYDAGMLKGIDNGDPNTKDIVFNKYVEAFDKGAYNTVKKVRNTNGRLVKQKYFSGGISSALSQLDPVKLSRDQILKSMGGTKEVIEVNTRFLDKFGNTRVAAEDYLYNKDQISSSLGELEKAATSFIANSSDEVANDFVREISSALVAEVQAVQDIVNQKDMKDIIAGMGVFTALLGFITFYLNNLSNVTDNIKELSLGLTTMMVVTTLILSLGRYVTSPAAVDKAQDKMKKVIRKYDKFVRLRSLESFEQVKQMMYLKTADVKMADLFDLDGDQIMYSNKDLTTQQKQEIIDLKKAFTHGDAYTETYWENQFDEKEYKELKKLKETISSALSSNLDDFVEVRKLFGDLVLMIGSERRDDPRAIIKNVLVWALTFTTVSVAYDGMDSITAWAVFMSLTAVIISASHFDIARSNRIGAEYVPVHIQYNFYNFENLVGAIEYNGKNRYLDEVVKEVKGIKVNKLRYQGKKLTKKQKTQFVAFQKELSAVTFDNTINKFKAVAEGYSSSAVKKFKNGFDEEGYDIDGYDKDGRNRYGFDKEGNLDFSGVGPMVALFLSAVAVPVILLISLSLGLEENNEELDVKPKKVNQIELNKENSGFINKSIEDLKSQIDAFIKTSRDVELNEALIEASSSLDNDVGQVLEKIKIKKIGMTNLTWLGLVASLLGFSLSIFSFLVTGLDDSKVSAISTATFLVSIFGAYRILNSISETEGDVTESKKKFEKLFNTVLKGYLKSFEQLKQVMYLSTKLNGIGTTTQIIESLNTMTFNYSGKILSNEEELEIKEFQNKLLDAGVANEEFWKEQFSAEEYEELSKMSEIAATVSSSLKRKKEKDGSVVNLYLAIIIGVLSAIIGGLLVNNHHYSKTPEYAIGKIKENVARFEDSISVYEKNIEKYEKMVKYYEDNLERMKDSVETYQNKIIKSNDGIDDGTPVMDSTTSPSNSSELDADSLGVAPVDGTSTNINGGISLEGMTDGVAVSSSTTAIKLSPAEIENIAGLTFEIVGPSKLMPLSQILSPVFAK